MSQKRGLGRGLGALLGEERPRPAPAATEGLLQLPLDAIRPNPQQPRTVFDREALVELEQSIRELGVLVPIIVRPRAGGTTPLYELIAGERRWRAAAAAKLATIPAIVRSADDRTSLELAVVENLQRRDLDPIEEAMGFAHLIDDYEFTQERLAERIGKSRPAIANALRLLALSDPIKAELRSGALTVGHARALLAVPEAEREALARRIVAEGLSVRAVEQLGATKRPPVLKRTKTRAPRDPNIEAVETQLRYHFGTAVSVVPGGRGGRLEFRYASEEDLTRLIDLLLPADPAGSAHPSTG
jgi:ParB family chromosome partitioning protein